MVRVCMSDVRMEDNVMVPGIAEHISRSASGEQSYLLRFTSSAVGVLTIYQMMYTGDRPRIERKDDRNSDDLS